MKIALITPAGARSRTGNRHTAARWAAMLRSLGHDVRVAVEWDGAAADVMLALHARRSHASIAAFRKAQPRSPLIVVLTGTDLYRDIRHDADAKASLELADRLVVLQDQGVLELPRRLRSKTRVVYQSAAVTRPHAPPARAFRVAVIGHLREEKDPFRAALALEFLPDLADVEIVHLGDALGPGTGEEARALMRAEPRYRWLGGVAHSAALAWLARSDALVVSSNMEGGANVICEAAAVGVPVLASRIPGNLGMLGRSYPGYFPLGDERRLAALIRRASRDASFYRSLKRGMAERRPLFRPQAERSALRRLVAELARGRQSRAESSARTGSKLRR
jgi:putative glycosyltransferase (TIGR04348 family)